MTTRTSWQPAASLAALLAVTATLGAPLPAQATPTPPPAVPEHAGYYAQAVCSDEGEPSGTEYWLAEPELPGFGYPVGYGHLDTCAESGALTLRDEASLDAEPETGPSYTYEAPPGMLIAGGFAKLAMTSPGGKTTLEAAQQSKPALTLASCDSSCTGVHNATVAIPDTDWWVLWAKALCEPASGQSKCTTGGVNAELSINSAMVLLHTEATPEAIGLTGSLTESPVSGTASLSLTAKEADGPGIYRASVQIDGSTVWAQTPETSFGQCVAHGTYEKALVFHNAVPCKAEVPVHVEIPTATFPDGPHLVEVIVEDAAGDRSVVFDKTLTFTNHPASDTPPQTSPTTTTGISTVPPAPPRGPANGSPASEVATIAAHWASTKAALSTTSAYGHACTIDGRLTNPAGTPIVGAVIEVSDRPSAVGASASAMTSTRTASDGSFSVKVPAGESTTYQLAYRSHMGDATPAASIILSLAVPASIHLAVSRRVASVGQGITLTGKLAGTLGVHGKHLIVEARGPGEPWLEFHGANAGSSGRFSVHHKFKFPGPVRYQFRVICEPEPAFPFSRGVSNTVSVWER